MKWHGILALALLAGTLGAEEWRSDTFAVWPLRPESAKSSSVISFSDWLVFGNAHYGEPGIRAIVNQMAASGLPMVVWGADMGPGQRYPSVGGDNIAGGRLAAEHLLAQGRVRIAFLGDPELPEVLLPSAWPGHQARLLCKEIYHRLLLPSERHLDAHLHLANGQTPMPGPMLAQRFEALDPLLAPVLV